MSALLFRMARELRGALRVCRNVEEIEQCLDAGVLAAVLHIEGAEAIDENFEVLQVLHAAGLRSLGPVWSRPNAFGHGVPFRCPASPDTGPGLTDLGKALIRACSELKILIDLSHLNEQGFWDVAAISDAPLVATHSNAHRVSPHSRNSQTGNWAQFARARAWWALPSRPATCGLTAIATRYYRRLDPETRRPCSGTCRRGRHRLRFRFRRRKNACRLGKCRRAANDRAIAAQPRVWRASDRKTVLQKLAEGIEKNLGTCIRPKGRTPRYETLGRHGKEAARGRLYRSHPQARQAGRPAGATADVRGQPARSAYSGDADVTLGRWRALKRTF